MLREEGYPEDQAWAIAYSYRDRGDLPKAQLGLIKKAKPLAKSAVKYLKANWPEALNLQELGDKALGYTKELFPGLLNPDVDNLKDLYQAQDFADKYNYEFPKNLEFLSESNLRTDKAVQNMMNVHNTFSRGVNTDWDYLKEQKPEVLELLEEAGIDYINEPKKAAEYMLTHIPGNTGYGRVGLRTDWNEAGLYTSNSEGTSDPYTYGSGYRGVIRRPVDYSSSDRGDWITKNDFNLSNRDYIPLTKEEDIIWNEAYNKLNRWVDGTKAKFLARQRIEKEEIIQGGDITYEQAFANIDKEINDKISEIQELPEYGGVRFDLDRRQGDPFTDAERKSLTTFRQYTTYGTDPLYVELRDLEAKKWNLRVNLNSEANRWQGEEAARSLKDDYPELYEKIAPSMLKIDHGIMKQDYSQGDNPYAHYVFMGYPGQKVADPISLEKMTDAKLAESSRAHRGVYSEGYSKKDYGGELSQYQLGGLKKAVKPAAKYIKQNIYEPLIESVSETPFAKYVSEIYEGLFPSALKENDFYKAGQDYMNAQKLEASPIDDFKWPGPITDPAALLPKYATVQREGIQHRLKVADKLDKISDPNFTIKGKPATVDIIKTSEWPKHAKNLTKIHGVPKRQLDNVKKYMDEEGITEINTKDLINRIDKELSFDIKIIPRSIKVEGFDSDFMSMRHDPETIKDNNISETVFNRGTQSEHTRAHVKNFTGPGGDLYQGKTHFKLPWSSSTEQHAPGTSNMDYFWRKEGVPPEITEGMTEADYLAEGTDEIKYYRKLSKGLATEVPISRKEYKDALQEYSRRASHETTKEYESLFSLEEYKDNPDWVYKEAEIVTPDIINREKAHFSTSKSPQNKGANQRVLGHIRYYENINPNSPEYLDKKIGEMQSDPLQDRSEYLGNYMKYKPHTVKDSDGVGRGGPNNYPASQVRDEWFTAENNLTDLYKTIKQNEERITTYENALMRLEKGEIGIHELTTMNNDSYWSPEKYLSEELLQREWNQKWQKGKMNWVDEKDLPFNEKIKIEVKEPKYWNVRTSRDDKRGPADGRGNSLLYKKGQRMSWGEEVSIYKKQNSIGQTKYYEIYHYTPEKKIGRMDGSKMENVSWEGGSGEVKDKDGTWLEGIAGYQKGTEIEITKDKFNDYLNIHRENQKEFLEHAIANQKRDNKFDINNIPFREKEVKKAKSEFEFAEKQIENYDKQNEFYKYLAEDNKWVDVFKDAVLQWSHKTGSKNVSWPQHETAAKMQTHTPHEKKIQDVVNRFRKLEERRAPLHLKKQPKVIKNAIARYGYAKTWNERISEADEKKYEELTKQMKEAQTEIEELTAVTKNKQGKVTEHKGMHQKSPVEYFYKYTLPRKLARDYGNTFQSVEDEYGYKWGKQPITEDVIEKTKNITFREGGSVTPWNTFMVLPPEAYVGDYPEYQWGGLVKGAKAIGSKGKKYISEGFHKAYDPIAKWVDENYGDDSELNQRLLNKHVNPETGYINIIPPGKGGPIAPVLRTKSHIIKDGLNTAAALKSLSKDIYKVGKSELFGSETENLPVGFGYEPYTIQEQQLQKAIRLLGKEMYKHQDVLKLTDKQLATDGIGLQKSQNALNFLKLLTEGQASILTEQQFKSLTGKEKGEIPEMIDRFEKRITHLQGLKETKEDDIVETNKSIIAQEPSEGSPEWAEEQIASADFEAERLEGELEDRWSNENLVGHLRNNDNVFWNDLSQRARTMLVSDIRRNFGNTVDGERVDHQWVKDLWHGLSPAEQAPYIERILLDPFFTVTQRNMFGSSYNIPNSQLEAYDNTTSERDVNTDELSESDMHEYIDNRTILPRERDQSLWEGDRTYFYDESGDPASVWNLSRIMDAVNGSNELTAEEASALLGEAKANIDSNFWDSFWTRYGPDVQNKWPINIETIEENIMALGENTIPMSEYTERLYEGTGLTTMLEDLADIREELTQFGGTAWSEFLEVQGDALRRRWSMEETTNEELDALLSRRIDANEEVLEQDQQANLARETEEEILDEALPHDNTIDLNRILPGHSPRITTRVDPQADESATADPDWDTILPVAEYDRTLPLVDGSQEPTPFMRFTSIPRGDMIIDEYGEDLYNLDVHVASLSDDIQSRYAEISNGRRQNEGTHDWAERIENLPWEDWYNEGISQIGFMEWELANGRIPASAYFIRLDRVKRLEAWLHGPNDLLLNPAPSFIDHEADLLAIEAATAPSEPEVPSNFTISRDSRIDHIANLIMYRGEGTVDRFNDLPLPVQSALAIVLRTVPGLRDGHGTDIPAESFTAAQDLWESPQISINDMASILNKILTHPFITQREKKLVGEWLDLPSDDIHSLYSESQRVGRRNLLNKWGAAVSWDELSSTNKNAISHAKYYGYVQQYPDESSTQRVWESMPHKEKIILITDGIKRRNMSDEIRSTLMEMLDFTHVEKTAIQMLGRRMDTEPINWEGGFADPDGVRLINQQATEVAVSIADGGVLDEAEALKVLANGMNEFGEWSSSRYGSSYNNPKIVLPEAFYQTLAEEFDIQPADVVEHIRNTRRLGYPLTSDVNTADIETTDPDVINQYVDRAQSDIDQGSRDQWRQRNMDLANEHLAQSAENQQRSAEVTYNDIDVTRRSAVAKRQKYQNIGNTKVSEALQKYGPGSGFINKHIKELNAKVNSKAARKVGIAPESENRRSTSVLNSLFYSSGDPVIKKLAEGWKKVEDADPGKVFNASGSLSGDSYRAQLWFMNKYGFGTKRNPKHMLDVQWHGWDTLNDSEFARSAKIPRSITINELNDYIKKINAKLPHGKRMPYAHQKGNATYVPRLTFERLDNTPDKKMGGTIYEKYDQTLFIYQMGGAITDKEKQHLLTGYGITTSPEPGEIEEEETITIDGEPLHMELAFDIYKNYIQGTYANSTEEEKAAKIYDKVNRMYYKDAKNAGISVGNYVLSKVIQEGIYS